MKINKNSWHYRLVLYFAQKEEAMPDTSCAYFFKLTIVIFLNLIAMFLALLVSGIIFGYLVLLLLTVIAIGAPDEAIKVFGSQRELFVVISCSIWAISFISLVAYNFAPHIYRPIKYRLAKFNKIDYV